MASPQGGTAVAVLPSGAPLGAEMVGVDVVHALDEATCHRREAADHAHTVVLRQQRLTPDELRRFARRFGALALSPHTQFALPGHPEILSLQRHLRSSEAPHGQPRVHVGC